MSNQIRRWTRNPFVAALGVMGVIALGSSVQAGDIQFTPTGSGTSYTIGGIDPAPGSALAVNALPLTVGESFQLYYQAGVPALIGTNGLDFTPTGLGSTYQLTVVGSFTEVVTSLTASGAVATFALAPTQSPNSFFEMYYNPAAVANNLAGTGFNVGTLVFAGTPASNLPSVSVYSKSTSGGSPVTATFDEFTHKYPGITTDVGSGSSLLTVNVKYINPAFDSTPISLIGFNSSIVTPFDEQSPSLLFDGAPGTAPPNVLAHIGTVNGESGPDFQFQADSNLTFTLSPGVPEPASVILAGLGLLGGLCFVACRRK
jgi:hypothetical protein